MKRDVENRLARKQAQFIERTTALYPNINLKLFTGKPLLAIRVNPLMPHAPDITGDPIPWASHCFIPIGQSRHELTTSSAFSGGALYLQNPSSFIPPIVLKPAAKEKILDMCAAPGGKASHIAALSNNTAELWVNDNSKARLLRMKQNLKRLGVRPYKETMLAIDKIAKELPLAYFDKILLDAPCSGEGALQIDNSKSMTYWSIAQIKRLQQLQKQAIRAAWQLLKPGGSLVYSTCTMAPEENESVIDWLLTKYEGAFLVNIDLPIKERTLPVTAWQGRKYKNDLSGCVRIKPDHSMEAFFVAKVVKSKLYYEE